MKKLLVHSEKLRLLTLLTFLLESFLSGQTSQAEWSEEKRLFLQASQFERNGLLTLSIAQANDSISLRKADVKQSIQGGLAKEMKFDHNFIDKLHVLT